MKKYKMLFELVSQQETEHGGIGIRESVSLINDLSKVAKKHKFDGYVKGYPKDKLDYKPTNKKIVIKTLDDIAGLTEQQFEFFIDDLRSWCNMMRGYIELEKLGIANVGRGEGMTWLDTGLNESKINIEIQGSNKF